MSFHPADYPPNWREVRAAVLVRADGRCEWRTDAGDRCPALNHVWYHRGLHEPELLYECAAPPPDFCLNRDIDEFCPFEARPNPIRIVLTTAHLCRCLPKCGDLTHLASLCQRHHLVLDGPEHARKAALTRAKKRGQLVLL